MYSKIHNIFLLAGLFIFLGKTAWCPNRDRSNHRPFSLKKLCLQIITRNQAYSEQTLQDKLPKELITTLKKQEKLNNQLADSVTTSTTLTEQLLDLGADPNYRTDDGSTPFTKAVNALLHNTQSRPVSHENFESIRTLIAYGAQTSTVVAINNVTEFPIGDLLSRYFQREKDCSYLIAICLRQIHVKNMNGLLLWTVQQDLAPAHRISLFSALVKLGADPNIKISNNKTVLELLFETTSCLNAMPLKWFAKLCIKHNLDRNIVKKILENHKEKIVKAPYLPCAKILIKDIKKRYSKHSQTYKNAKKSLKTLPKQSTNLC